MGLIKEPLDVDLYVGDERATEEDLRIISEFIRRQKRGKAVKAPTPVRRIVVRRKKELA